MNDTIMQEIYNKIIEYDRIFLFRHIGLDGDCIGATKGLKEILNYSFPNKEVYIIDNEISPLLDYLGSDDKSVAVKKYRDSLGIVLDTPFQTRISNPNYRHCKELIKIDHHTPFDSFGSINWVEEHRSSCCEMIVSLCDGFQGTLKINRKAALCLYAGMVTDTDRFRSPEVTPETLLLASSLLSKGVNSQALFSHLYAEPRDILNFKAFVYSNIQFTEHGVAYVHIPRGVLAENHLSLESASKAIDLLDHIQGSICWIAFIESGNKSHSVRVRLRSRFVPVNSLAEHYRGGGNPFSAGATVYGAQEIKELIQEADQIVKEYQKTHEGWI